MEERDEHTGLLTWTAFVGAIPELHHRRGGDVAIAFIDVDDLRRINDEHGRLVGDIVLRTLASRLVIHSGPAALMGRAGGDEFAVALTVSRQHVRPSVAALLAALTAHPVELDDRAMNHAGAVIQVSVAIGAAFGGEIHTIVDRAWTALDEAKRRGAGFIEVLDEP